MAIDFGKQVDNCGILGMQMAMHPILSELPEVTEKKT